MNHLCINLLIFSFIIEDVPLCRGHFQPIILIASQNKTGDYVVKKIDESLELSCQLKTESDHDNQKCFVRWHVPPIVQNRFKYKISNNTDGSLSLLLNKLQESDAGDYRCEVHSCPAFKSQCKYNSCDQYLYSFIRLIVRKKSQCGFQCAPNVCIPERFKCDGKTDCENHSDEANCGDDPCADKIKCADGRCIPSSWCCTPGSNCTNKWDIDCCPKIYKDPNSAYYGSPKHFKDYQMNSLVAARQMNDLKIINTIVHSVIACALVFVVVGPILALAVCRVQIRRRANRHQSPRFTPAAVIQRRGPRPSHVTDRSRYASVPSFPPNFSSEVPDVDDVELCLRRWEVLNSTEDSSYLRDLLAPTVLVERLDPPPYSEVALPRDDLTEPPPPYSCLDVSSPNDERKNSTTPSGTKS